jgi:hypothetical protein
VACERSHDLFRRGGDDVDPAPLPLVEFDQLERLQIDIGVDHFEQDVLDEPLHLSAIPPLRELEHPFLQTLHLPLVGADEQVHQLSVGASHQLSARHHARAVQRTRQR